MCGPNSGVQVFVSKQVLIATERWATLEWRRGKMKSPCSNGLFSGDFAFLASDPQEMLGVGSGLMATTSSLWEDWVEESLSTFLAV